MRLVERRVQAMYSHHLGNACHHDIDEGNGGGLMAFDHRLHQLEERVEQLEKSHRRLIYGILRALGENIEEAESNV